MACVVLREAGLANQRRAAPFLPRPAAGTQGPGTYRVHGGAAEERQREGEQAGAAGLAGHRGRCGRGDPVTLPHVMVVAYDFPPHGAVGTQRTLRLVRHLASAGWRVTVVTADPRDYLPGTPVDAAQLDRVPSSVGVVRTPVLRGVTRLVSRLRGARPPSNPTAVTSRESPKIVGTATATAPRPSTLRWLVRHFDAVTTIPDAEVGWLWPGVRGGIRAARAIEAGCRAVLRAAMDWPPAGGPAGAAAGRPVRRGLPRPVGAGAVANGPADPGAARGREVAGTSRGPLCRPPHLRDARRAGRDSSRRTARGWRPRPTWSPTAATWGCSTAGPR